jgi:ATP-dependent Clp protease adaptor protein ClpS
MPKISEEVESKLDLDKPSMYKVILHNDDYTTMEFVVMILTDIFHKNIEEAHKIMWNIHKKGRGIAGIYTYEIAQTKVKQVLELAKDNEFPLLVTMEEE